MRRGGRSYRIISDPSGSIRFVIDVLTGSIAQRIDYDAFGRVVRDTNPGFQPFGFAGGLYDRHTGLVRLGSRDYDPTTGRWTLKEPNNRFRGADLNLYRYANGDPVNFVDHDGKVAIAVEAVIVGGAIIIGGCYVTGSCKAFSDAVKDLIMSNEEASDAAAAPDIPDDLYGDNPRDSTGKRTNTDLPSGDFEDAVKDLTGGNLTGLPGGHQVCPNGVRVRPPKNGEGPRIDIPAKGSKPPETIHFPPETPWPF